MGWAAFSFLGYMRFVDLSCAWCMERGAAEDYLHTYDSIMARRLSGAALNKAEIEAALGRDLGQAGGYSVKDGIAVVPIRGAIVKHGDMLSEVSGTPSVDGIRGQIDAALADASVRGIVLDFNSPGGQVNGIANLAAHIHEMKSSKPIRAYSDGALASAAYWLASACDEIVVSSTAHPVGGIGALFASEDDKAAQEAKGVKRYTFTSSSNKIPDPATESGSAQIQALVNAVGSVFVADVAKYRGISEKAVVEDFNDGGSFAGQDAVSCGLADRSSSLDAFLESFSAELGGALPQGGFNMEQNSLLAKMATMMGLNPTTGEPDPIAAENAQLRAQLADMEAKIASLSSAPPAPDAKCSAFVAAYEAKVPPAQREGVDAAKLYSQLSASGSADVFLASLPVHPLAESIKVPAPVTNESADAKAEGTNWAAVNASRAATGVLPQVSVN